MLNLVLDFLIQFTCKLNKQEQVDRRLSSDVSNSMLLRLGARTRQTDGTDESNVHNVLVTETRRSKINLVLGRDGKNFANRGWGQERHLECFQ